MIISPCLYEGYQPISRRGPQVGSLQPDRRGPPPLPSTPRCPPAYPLCPIPCILGARESPSSVRHLIQGPQRPEIPISDEEERLQSKPDPHAIEAEKFQCNLCTKPIRPSGLGNTGSCTVTPSPGNPSSCKYCDKEYGSLGASRCRHSDAHLTLCLQDLRQGVLQTLVTVLSTSELTLVRETHSQGVAVQQKEALGCRPICLKW